MSTAPSLKLSFKSSLEKIVSLIKLKAQRKVEIQFRFFLSASATSADKVFRLVDDPLRSPFEMTTNSRKISIKLNVNAATIKARILTGIAFVENN